ncbi:MAG: type II toxin-antitoxin system prevent-host-death family antitoxin [Prevotella sp.]|jgi:prevent-host-death family protein|nr:type II toxin-antitoxin system prevent-host-death family antitoxin [Prevotella sp.]
MTATTVKPVSDLRAYNKVLKECGKGEPVILTKNGRGAFVVMSIDEYGEIMKLCALGEMELARQSE